MTEHRLSTSRTETSTSLLAAEVHRFCEAALRGEYYDSFDVNSKNFMDKSRGTEGFIAEMNHLLGKCMTRAGRRRSPALVCETFEHLFSVAGKVDESPEDVIFFADEPGAWQLRIDWKAVLPAYFRCLVIATDASEYARRTRAMSEHLPADVRRQALAAARKVAGTTR